MGISISSDGKSMVFGVAHESDAEQTCIYLMHFKDASWTSPDKSFLDDNVNTFFPMFSPSGDELYFARSTENSDTDLWVVSYSDHKATDPRPLDAMINSSSREAGHGKSLAGSFYFTSNRDDQYQCCGDIFMKDGATVQKVSELNSTADEESLYLSPLGDYIIIQSWRAEFQSKHDLYISYLTRAGSWTAPKRLNSDINGTEIEQRPFVTPDNDFLFFSRTSVAQENGKDVYDSDIYWVSTRLIFGPYVYNENFEAKVIQGAPFELQLPKDLFKDVDDDSLSYEIKVNDVGELPEWINFDADEWVLNGSWKTTASLELKVIATDPSGNSEEFTINLEASNK